MKYYKVCSVYAVQFCTHLKWSQVVFWTQHSFCRSCVLLPLHGGLTQPVQHTAALGAVGSAGGCGHSTGGTRDCRVHHLGWPHFYPSFIQQLAKGTQFQSKRPAQDLFLLFAGEIMNRCHSLTVSINFSIHPEGGVLSSCSMGRAPSLLPLFHPQSSARPTAALHQKSRQSCYNHYCRPPSHNIIYSLSRFLLVRAFHCRNIPH